MINGDVVKHILSFCYKLNKALPGRLLYCLDPNSLLECIDRKNKDGKKEYQCNLEMFVGIGDLDIFQFYQRKRRITNLKIEDCFISAAENGQINIIEYMKKSGYKSVGDLPSYSAKNGQLECLMDLHRMGFTWTQKTTLMAAQNNQFDCLIYCIKNNCPYSHKVVNIIHRVGMESILDNDAS